MLILFSQPIEYKQAKRIPYISLYCSSHSGPTPRPPNIIIIIIVIDIIVIKIYKAHNVTAVNLRRRIVRNVIGTNLPWDESSRVRIVHGTNRPGYELSMGRIVQGTNRP